MTANKMRNKTLVSEILLISTVLAVFVFAVDAHGLQRKIRTSTLAPSGFINAAKAKTDYIVNQAPMKQNYFDSTVSRVQKFFSLKFKEKVSEKKTEQLKDALPLSNKKNMVAVASPPVPNSAVSVSTDYVLTPEGSVTVGDDYDVEIGTGILQLDENGDGVTEGDWVAEYIDGIKHIYVGFDKAGFGYDGTTDPLQRAIDMARAGDVIIVAGDNAGYFGDISINGDIRLYGGYDSDGNRAVYEDYVNIMGDVNVSGASNLSEMNGFRFFEGTLTVTDSKFAAINDGYGSGINGYNISTTGVDSHFWLDVDSSWGMIGNLTIGGVFNWGGKPDDLSVSNMDSQKTIVPVYTYSIEDNNDTEYPTIQYEERDSFDDDYLDSAFKTYRASDNVTDKNKRSLNKTSALDSDILDNEAEDHILQPDVMEKKINEYALSLSITGFKDAETGQVDVIESLSSMFPTPNIIQKSIIEFIKAFLEDMEKVENQQGAGKTDTFKNELLQKTAELLLAQTSKEMAVESDIAELKEIFASIGLERTEIIDEYKEAINAYYKSIIEEIGRSLSMKDISEILSKVISDEEVTRMPRSEIDKLLETLREKKELTEKEERFVKKVDEIKSAHIRAVSEKMTTYFNGLTEKLSAKLNKLTKD